MSKNGGAICYGDTTIAEPVNLIDALILETSGEAGEETYSFKPETNQAGRVFTLRRLRSADELARAFKRGKRLSERTDKDTPASWHRYLPISPETARSVAFLEAGVVEPKLETLDCLKLARLAGALFLELSSQITGDAFGGQAERDEETIEELGNG